ncbi:hypothetical protein [Xenorhabdus sp. SGI246]
MSFFDQIVSMLSRGKNQQIQHMVDWVEGQGGLEIGRKNGYRSR